MARTPGWMIGCLYAAGLGLGLLLLLLVQHWVHVSPVLPWLIFLACFLGHLFLHRRQHH